MNSSAKCSLLVLLPAFPYSILEWWFAQLGGQKLDLPVSLQRHLHSCHSPGASAARFAL